MSFSWAGIFLFGTASVGILLLIAIYDMPVEEIVDRRTGVLIEATPIEETVPLLPGPEEALRIARNTGDARTAVALLHDLQSRVRNPSLLDPAIRALDVELAPPGTGDGTARRILAEWDGTGLTAETGLALLGEIEQDGAVSGPMEAFFAPTVTLEDARENLDRWLAEGRSPDRNAVALLRLAREAPEAYTAERCAAVARCYFLPTRARARVRWMLRAVRLAPASPERSLELARTYLDLGRQREALLAVSCCARAGAMSYDVFQQQATIAGWVSVPAEEAAGLEGIVSLDPDEVEARRRLIVLYHHQGDLEAALPHIVYLARREGTPEALGKAAAAALDAWDTDLAILLFGEASYAAEDPRPWREKIVEVCLIDSRVDEALFELRSLDERWPGTGYGARLEDLLRRFNRTEELADRLFARIRSGSDRVLEAEATELFTALGREDRVREILLMQIRRMQDPAEFFAHLWGWWNVELPGLPEKASEMARSPRLDEQTATHALLLLDGMREEEGFVTAAWEIIERYPDAPTAVPFHARAAREAAAAAEAAGEVVDPSPEQQLRALLDRARRSDLPLDERLEVAQKLFDAGYSDVALALFESVLEERPEERIALLRAGQIKAWGNDVPGAIPLFERCLELHGPGDGELPFLLGECYWSAERPSDAMEQHDRALALLRGQEFLGPTHESMVARIYTRLGREEEARAIYDRLLDLQGDSIDLILDYADSLVILSDLDAAETLLARALELAPEDARVLRFAGNFALQTDRFEEALAAFDRGQELYGPDGNFSTGSAEALLGLGRLADATSELSESLALQPDNTTLASQVRRLSDRLSSPVVEVETHHSSAGRDRVLSFRAEGSVLLDREWTRFSLAMEHGKWSGLAGADGRRHEAAVAGVSLAVSHRFDSSFELGGGLDLFPTVGGRSTVGVWCEGRLESRRPYGAVELRLFTGELLRDPAAAVALSGTRDGISATGFLTFGPDWWSSGRLRGGLLTVDAPGEDPESDTVVDAELLVGRWIRGAGPEIQNRIRPRHAAPVGEGTTLAGEPPVEQGPRVAVWLAWSSLRLLDDGKLATLLPIAKRYDYLTATVRGIESVGDGLYLEAEGWAGWELGTSEPTGGVRAGVAWRPRRDLEIRFQGSRGLALGRTTGGDAATSVSLAITMSF